MSKRSKSSGSRHSQTAKCRQARYCTGFSPHWVEKYDDIEHFEQTENAIHKFIDRNKDDTNPWNAKNAIHHLEIQNFETITGVVGRDT